MTGVVCGAVFFMLAVGIYLCGAYFVYLRAFRSNKDYSNNELALPGSSVLKVTDERMLKLINDINEIPHEEIEIVSYDGTKLFGRYYHFSDDAPVDIQFHGYKSRASRDCCGIFRISRDMGHNVLLVDQRAHGKSGGRTITFGIKERFDCLEWARYASKRFGKDKKILLFGLSMGAATVLMASSLSLPRGVVGIISDSAYTSPREILFKVGTELHYPRRLMATFIAASAFIFGKFDIDCADCVKSVKTTKLPVLFLHGQDDFFVPCEMSRKVFAACKCNKNIVTFANGGHCAAYIFNTEKYVNAINDFCGRILKDSVSDHHEGEISPS